MAIRILDVHDLGGDVLRVRYTDGEAYEKVVAPALFDDDGRMIQDELVKQELRVKEVTGWVSAIRQHRDAHHYCEDCGHLKSAVFVPGRTAETGEVIPHHHQGAPLLPTRHMTPAEIHDYALRLVAETADVEPQAVHFERPDAG